MKLREVISPISRRRHFGSCNHTDIERGYLDGQDGYTADDGLDHNPTKPGHYASTPRATLLRTFQSFQRVHPPREYTVPPQLPWTLFF